MSKEFTSELALSLQGQLAAPVLEFPGGDQAFSFPLQHSSGSSGFAFRGSPGLSLLWQIEASDPCSVLIQLLDGTTDRPAKSLRLSFSNELLPNLSCTPTETGAYVVAVTSDGRLHKLTFSLSQEDSLEEGSPSLRCTHKYASILPALERSGFPTYVQVCAEKICIGTSRGSVICLDPSLDLASISELKSGYNLPKVRKQML